MTSDHRVSRVHGVLDDRELAALGIAREAVVDFGASTNPYGPCRAVLEAVRAARIDTYPEADDHGAREALAGMLGDASERLLLGSGATELLWAAVRGFTEPGDQVLVATPAFSEVLRACHVARVRVMEQRAEPPGFDVDLAAMQRRALAGSAVLVALGAPTSAVGTGVSAAGIARVCQALPRAVVVVDESFLSLSERHRDASVRLPDNAIRIRSLTKDHALAGLRLGYAVGAPALLERMARTLPECSVSRPAQAAAVVAASEGDFVRRSRRRLLDDRRRLQRQLREIGLSPVGSSAPYFIVPVPDPDALRRRLLVRHAVHVRDAGSFGLSGHVRIAARRDRDCERLIAALAAEL